MEKGLGQRHFTGRSEIRALWALRIGFGYGGLRGSGRVPVRAGKEQMRSLRGWAVICLLVMLIGPIGTALLPKAVFGLFERFSTFSAVVFNAVLGVCLMRGQFETPEFGK